MGLAGATSRGVPGGDVGHLRGQAWPPAQGRGLETAQSRHYNAGELALPLTFSRLSMLSAAYLKAFLRDS